MTPGRWLAGGAGRRCEGEVKLPRSDRAVLVSRLRRRGSLCPSPRRPDIVCHPSGRIRCTADTDPRRCSRHRREPRRRAPCAHHRAPRDLGTQRRRPTTKTAETTRRRRETPRARVWCITGAPPCLSDPGAGGGAAGSGAPLLERHVPARARCRYVRHSQTCTTSPGGTRPALGCLSRFSGALAPARGSPFGWWWYHSAPPGAGGVAGRGARMSAGERSLTGRWVAGVCGVLLVDDVVAEGYARATG
jgi:hypothetical protein